MSAPAPAGTPGKIDPFHHVIDSSHVEISESMHLHFDLPNIAGFQVTKFHVLLGFSALVTGLAFWWLGRKIRTGDSPKGTLWNMLEALVLFIRDSVARPGIGKHDGDKYVPFLTTMFTFILVANLLGMIPFLGSPTASIAVTFALALCSFAVIHASGVKEMGPFPYLGSFVPHLHVGDSPVMKVFGLVLMAGMAVLEYATAFIRLAVLAIRLFANMLAGHTALFMILFFIQFVSRPVSEGGFLYDPPGWLWWLVAPASVVMVFLLSLLELLVAALQAFVFTLLTAIFIGLAKHPAH
jgi:F-type H+-transporting ATPase subunit a